MNAETIAKRHWRWATNALKAANRDAASRDPQNAVSRAYYAMMHAANAALAMKGLQWGRSRTHVAASIGTASTTAASDYGASSPELETLRRLPGVDDAQLPPR